LDQQTSGVSNDYLAMRALSLLHEKIKGRK
jgi:hypothetical protein